MWLMLSTLSLAAQSQEVPPIKWSVAAQLPTSGKEPHLGLAGAASGVHNDVLLVAGGANFPDGMPWKGGQKQYHNLIYVLRKNARGHYQWHSQTFRLPFNLAYAATVSTPQGVLCVGGENETGILPAVLLMQWDAASQKVVTLQLPALPQALTNAAAALIGHTVYVAGGETESQALTSFLSLDLTLPATWKPLPDLPAALSHAVAVAQSGGDHPFVYVMGGRTKTAAGISQLHNSTYRYDPDRGTWDQLAPLARAANQTTTLSAGTGLALGASYILLFGGDTGEVFSRIEQYNAAIAAAGSAAVKARLQAEKEALLTRHRGFSKDILLYNTLTDQWTAFGQVPAAHVTTTAVKWGDDIFIPSGEVQPGIRSAAVLRGEVVKQSYFSWIDMTVIAVCFLLMTVARYFFTHTHTSPDGYFTGGQQIPKWAAAISIFGAKLSAITFMGIPAKTYATNWTYFFLLMTIIMVMPLVGRYFIPFYRRLNVTSAYEYLEQRFNYGPRLLASVLYILLQFGRMGIVVLLPSLALTMVTGINVYACIALIGVISIFFTVKGGIEAVIWVEVVQVLILAGGALFCLFYLPFHIGNISEAVQALDQYDKLKVFDFRFDFTQPTFWVVVIGGLAINLFTYGADQTTVQRYLTTRNEAESVKSLQLGAWLTLPSTLVFFTIGTLLYLFFRVHPQEVNISHNNHDSIFPWYIVSQLPPGLAGLLIAGIFAAAMSSTEASMNSVATLLTTDFYKKIRRDAPAKVVLRFARLATLTIGILVTLIAMWMASQGIPSLWDQFNTILGLFTGCIGGVFLLGIFTSKANSTGALLGMLGSCLVQLWVYEYTAVNFLLYSFTGLASCVLLGYLFSWLTGGPNKDVSALTIFRLAALKAAPAKELKDDKHPVIT